MTKMISTPVKGLPALERGELARHFAYVGGAWVSGAQSDAFEVEQDFELGGDLLNESSPELEAKRQSLVLAVQKAGVRIMTRTTAFGLYDNGIAGLLERVTDHLEEPSSCQPRQRFWTVR